MGNFLGNSSSENENLETFSLIWLDTEVNTRLDNINAQRELREFINQLKTYEDEQQCQNDIRSLRETDRIIFMCSGSLGETVVPNIHNLRQMYSIYIFCYNKEKHEKWSKEYVKVRRVFNRKREFIDQIINDIKNEKFNRVDEQLSIDIYEGEDFSDKLLTQSTQNFIYSQILIDYLLQLPMTDREKSELYSLCQEEYKSNNSELIRINQFKKTYSSTDVISLYTDGNFLYKMLIKALRNKNIHLLFLLRYVIKDIQQQINKNHLLSSSICVYRSQLMSRSEFLILEQYRQKFISINAFLTAIPDRNTARHFLSTAIVTDDVEKVLFEIHADGTQENIQSFMNIIQSADSNQQQILFSIGSIFRLDDIGVGENNMKFIKITLCPKNHEELQPIFNYIENTYGNMKKTLLSFGLILRTLNKFQEAEDHYQQLMRILPHQHPDVQECEIALYTIVGERHKFEIVNDALNTFEKKLKVNNYLSAYEYCKRANDYRKKGEFQRAIEYYKKALEMFQDNQGEAGRCYKSLAQVYQEARQDDEALEYYEKARIYLRNYLGENHPELNEIDNNIKSLRKQ